MLELENVSAFYGKSQALHNVSIEVDKGEIVCLLGRNAAGKTTTMRCILGLSPPDKTGTIRFKGVDITRKPTHEIALMGIGWAPDDRKIFPDLTVRENLEIAVRKGVKGYWSVDEVFRLFPKLKELEKNKGIYLSGGEQKMLVVARALMLNPELLLLDEPCEGLAPVLVAELIETIKRIAEHGITILLAESNFKNARKLAERGYIMEKGVIQYQATIEEIMKNKEVLRRYLAV